MKKTKRRPILISLSYPDGTRIEARIPLWKAYAILSDLELEKEFRTSLAEAFTINLDK